METILVIAVGTLNIVCFLIGAKVGQSISKGETITAAIVNPVKPLGEKKSVRENEESLAEQRRQEIILQNIDNYDGTEIGQIDVPT